MANGVFNCPHCGKEIKEVRAIDIPWNAKRLILIVGSGLGIFGYVFMLGWALLPDFRLILGAAAVIMLCMVPFVYIMYRRMTIKSTKA